MKIYTAIAGQSIYDVCMQTYGSLDYLYKLMGDNSYQGLDAEVYSGQQFAWDETLVTNQNLNVAFAASGVYYATDLSNNGSVFYVVNGGGAPISGAGDNGSGAPYVPPVKPTIQQMVYNTFYTSNTDGLNQFTVTDLSGNPIIGFDILEVINEIKPLKPTQYSWNKSTATLTLIGPTVDAGMTAFILYSKTTP